MSTGVTSGGRALTVVSLVIAICGLLLAASTLPLVADSAPLGDALDPDAASVAGAVDGLDAGDAGAGAPEEFDASEPGGDASDAAPDVGGDGDGEAADRADGPGGDLAGDGTAAGQAGEDVAVPEGGGSLDGALLGLAALFASMDGSAAPPPADAAAATGANADTVTGHDGIDGDTGADGTATGNPEPGADTGGLVDVPLSPDGFEGAVGGLFDDANAVGGVDSPRAGVDPAAGEVPESGSGAGAESGSRSGDARGEAGVDGSDELDYGDGGDDGTNAEGSDADVPSADSDADGTGVDGSAVEDGDVDIPGNAGDGATADAGGPDGVAPSASAPAGDPPTDGSEADAGVDADADANGNGASAERDAADPDSSVQDAIPGSDAGPGPGALVAALALVALAVVVLWRDDPIGFLVSLPRRLLAIAVGTLLAVSRLVERALGSLGRLESIAQLPGLLLGALVAAVAALRSRASDATSALSPSNGLFGGDEAESAADRQRERPEATPRERIRLAWERVVAASDVYRQRVATPAEVARRAKASGAPPGPVDTITDAFRDVEYGEHDPRPRVGPATEASDALAAAPATGDREEGDEA